MEKTISDFYNFIKSFFETLWIIIARPGSFEELLLSSTEDGKQIKQTVKVMQKDNTEKEVKLLDPYVFFIIASFLLASLISDFSIFDKSASILEGAKTMLNNVIARISKNFSLFDAIVSVFPVFIITVIAGNILSKIYFFKSKKHFSQNNLWVLYILAFAFIIFSMSIILACMIYRALNAYSINSEAFGDDISILILLPLVGMFYAGIMSYVIIWKSRNKNPEGFFKKRHYTMNFIIPLIFLAVIINQVNLVRASEVNVKAEPLGNFNGIFNCTGKVADRTTVQTDVRFICTPEKYIYLEKDEHVYLEFLDNREDTAHYDFTLLNSIEWSITQWSDKNPETMTLKTGDANWVHVSCHLNTEQYQQLNLFKDITYNALKIKFKYIDENNRTSWDLLEMKLYGAILIDTIPDFAQEENIEKFYPPVFDKK